MKFELQNSKKFQATSATAATRSALTVTRRSSPVSRRPSRLTELRRFGRQLRERNRNNKSNGRQQQQQTAAKQKKKEKEGKNQICGLTMSRSPLPCHGELRRPAVNLKRGATIFGKQEAKMVKCESKYEEEM